MNENKIETMNENVTDHKNDVMESVLKLMRAMRRRPVSAAHEFPPAIQRTLWILSKNDGISAAELCEKLDVRPSSMSELLGRMEEKFLIKREADETDKRAAKILLTETGKEAAERMETRILEEQAKFSACFTEEEAAQLATLCDRLSVHLEETAEEEEFNRKHCGHHGGFGPKSFGYHNPVGFIPGFRFFGGPRMRVHPGFHGRRRTF